MAFKLKTWGGKVIQFRRLPRRNSWMRSRFGHLDNLPGFSFVTPRAFFGAVDAAWRISGKRWKEQTGYGIDDFAQVCALAAARYNDIPGYNSMSSMFKMFLGVTDKKHSKGLGRLREECGADESFYSIDDSDPLEAMENREVISLSIKNAELSPRFEEFFRRSMEGESLASIARDHRITRERVRQIVAKATEAVMMAGQKLMRPVTQSA